MMKKLSGGTKCSLLSLMLMFFGFSSLAQVTVKGKVTGASDGYEIPGVTVIVVGTSTGTTTNIDGEYQLTVPSQDVVLRYSFIGYKPVELTVGTRTVMDVALEEEVTALEEIVVVGYGTQKKKEVTGAVASIKSEVISKTATNDVNSSLQGAIAGVNVQASSGAPGANSNIQIRGIGSFSANGAQILYIVDGIPYAGVPNLSPNEVESVDVLKDGAAAAVYGTRASNGVVLVTTKQGKAGVSTIEYNGYYGIQDITTGVPLLNNIDQIIVDETIERQLTGSSTANIGLNDGALDRNIDYVDIVTREGFDAPIQNHDFAFTGGSENMTFAALVNYYSQDGNLINSGYERLSTRLNTKLTKGKFEGFSSIAVRTQESTVEPFSLLQSAITQRPYIPFPEGRNEVFVPFQNPQNIGNFANTLVNSDERTSNDINAALSLKYEFIDGLSLSVRAGGNINHNDRKFLEPQFIVRAANGEIEQLSSRIEAELLEGYFKSYKWTVENVLNYQKSFGVHDLTLTAAYTLEEFGGKQAISEKRSSLSNELSVFNTFSQVVSISGSESQQSLTGVLGRVQYSYDEKYILSASLRRDGSSRFGPSNRFGYFPGVSAGWNISEENFFRSSGISAYVDALKLRGSFAQVGNQNISNFVFQSTIESGTNYVFGPEPTGQDNLTIGALQRALPNENVKWETNISRNIGVDATLFGGKMTLTADVYRNSKEDMLVQVELPGSAGTRIPNTGNTNSTVTLNVGDMVNKGVELALGYRESEGEFTWDVNATFTRNINEVTRLVDGLGRFNLGGGKPVRNRPGDFNTTFLAVGVPVASFLLIPTDGLIDTEEELEAYQEIVPTARLGDLKYIDALTVDTDEDGVPDAGDGQIDDNDRVFMGSGTPDFELGLSSNLSYKNFDLYIQWYLAYGAEVYNGVRALAYQNRRHQDLLFQWEPSNPNSPIPTHRFNAQHPNVSSRSDIYLEDGTYLRLRNVTLGYTVPSSVFNDKISHLRVYVSAQNALTFTRYTGFDPEIGYTNDIFTRGVDSGNYPISRRFLLGVQLKF